MQAYGEDGRSARLAIRELFYQKYGTRLCGYDGLPLHAHLAGGCCLVLVERVRVQGPDGVEELYEARIDPVDENMRPKSFCPMWKAQEKQREAEIKAHRKARQAQKKAAKKAKKEEQKRQRAEAKAMRALRGSPCGEQHTEKRGTRHAAYVPVCA